MPTEGIYSRLRIEGIGLLEKDAGKYRGCGDFV